MEIPFFKPVISKKSIAAVTKVMESGWLTSGKHCIEFQDSFAKYTGAKYALALNSCTAALHLALDAIGLKAGDEVIIPVNTFTATGEVVEYFKAKPVLCDVRKDTQNINEKLIESKITKKTKAIIPVHYSGLPCEMDTIMKIARKHGLKVIEDAAHVTPAFYKNRPIGSIGDITCFSFYANKCITTGEGGMAVTDNKAWFDRMKMMSLHGMSKDAWNRYDKKGSWYYEVVESGFKYNMTDVAAALGVCQLSEANGLWKKRSAAAARYGKLFKEMKEVVVQPEMKGCKSSWHIYPIRVSKTIDRDGLINHLAGKGIKTSLHFIPLHMHPFYRDKYGYKPDDFPTALENYKRALTLPLFPGITEREQKYIVNAIKEFIKG
ncbi:MAG: DegT/DnrJ/EryC1/StrS family aminotransferase [Fibrobacteres bacterium]|nr:DegT/DnrJ/EryC1/StrS family aminotransferase [Fibrobacterota bacterium]